MNSRPNPASKKTPAPKKSAVSWRGEPELVLPPPRHRWQMERSEQPADRLVAGNKRIGPRVTFLLLLTASMLAGWLFFLLYAPVKTPLIAVSVTAYTWPLPPNAWALEDLQSLRPLHGKTIHLHDSSAAWQTKSMAIEDLRLRVRELSGLARRTGSLIVYLNVHGMVDQEGRACLIPSGSSPLDTSGWLTLDDIYRAINNELPEEAQALLVLDCVDEQSNWSAALIQSTFIESVGRWMDETKPARLAIITSTSDDERAWSGPDLNGSIFGREFCLGLAGMADTPIPVTREASSADSNVASASSTSSTLAGNDDLPGGNGDGRITLDELAGHVSRNVQFWALSQRGTPQTPRLFITRPAANAPGLSPKSFTGLMHRMPLSLALKRRELARHAATVIPSQLAPTSPSTTELIALWTQLDTLRQAQFVSTDAIGWTELERRLLWLEKCSQAGSAYSEAVTRRLYPELRKQLEELLGRSQQLSGNTSTLAREQDSTAPSSLAGTTRLPSIAWQEFLGRLDRVTAQSVRDRLKSVASGQDSWSAVQEAAAAALGQEPCNEVNFLGLLQKYDRLKRWPDMARVGDALDMRDRCERLAVLGDSRAHRLRRAELNALDTTRRLVEDELWIGPTADTEQKWTRLLQAIQRAGDISARVTSSEGLSPDSTCALSQLALTLRDQGLAEASYLAAWICSPDNGMDGLADWTRADSTRADSTRADSTRADSTRVDSTRADSTRSDSTRGAVAAGNGVMAADVSGLPTSGIDRSRRQNLAIERLRVWIENLHALGQLIASATQMEQGLIVPAIPQSESENKKLYDVCLTVQNSYRSLMELVQDQGRRVSDAKLEDRAALRSLDALLQLPMISTAMRQELSEKRLKWWRDSVEAGKVDSGPSMFTRMKSLATKSSSEPSMASFNAAIQPTSNANQTANESSEAAGLPVTSSLVSASPIEKMKRWSSHPLGNLLQLNKDPSRAVAESESSQMPSARQAECDAVNKANARLRAHYSNLATLDDRQLTEWREQADANWQLPTTRNAWNRAAIAEHVERAALALSPMRPERNHTQSFARVALADQLCWYAQRTLQDFYGLATSDNAANVATFFESAVNAILATVQGLPEATQYHAPELADIRQRMSVLGPLARHGLKASVKSGIPTAGSNEQNFELTLRPTLSTVQWSPSQSANSQSAIAQSATTQSSVRKFGTPAGGAVALVRSASGVLPSVQVSIDFPVEQSNRVWQLQVPSLSASTSHEAVVVFRGNEYAASLFVTQGIVVDYRPSRLDRAEVVLLGDRTRQASIQFVLDCSWSMGEQMPIEAIDSPTQSRLDLAKTQLIQLISQIASRPDARLGVRLFGHRLGWSRDVDPKTGTSLSKTQILPQPNYRGTIPDDLVPSRDVEAVVPLGRFDATMLPALQKSLSEIVPWGQTPLYLSIIESFKDFARDDVDTTKSIVVITDGDNFQFNANRLTSAQSGVQVSKADVLRAWQANKIPVYILGVGVSTDGATDVGKSLEDLAEKTGGKYYDVATGNDLLRALSEQLSTADYSVTRVAANGRNEEPLTARLNSPIELNQLKDAPVEFSIDIQTISETFKVEGGEALEMLVQADMQRLEARPYDRDAPRSGMLSRSGSNRRLLTRVHQPSLQSDGVLFPVSFQDPDMHYTERPKETWIEVMPLSNNSDAASPKKVYWFYDAEYQPGKPVPVQHWLASDWPKDANLADVRVWAKYEPTPAVVAIPLREVMTSSAEYANGRPVAGALGVSVRVNIIEGGDNSAPWQLQVTEVHAESSRGVGSISVHLDCKEVGVPQRVTHRFEPESRLATHTYSFEPAVGSMLSKSSTARILIRTREAVQTTALQLPSEQAIRVELLPTQDLLPLPVR